MKRLLVVPVLVVVLASSAYAVDSPCARAITKASAKYVMLRAKAIQKCDDGRIRGSLPPSTDCEANATTTAITGAARTHFTSSVASKCGGNDGTGGTGDDPSLGSYGWGGVASGPSLRSSAGSGAITNCGGIVTCLTCLDDEAVRETFDLASGSLNAGQFGSNSEINKCQRAIAKATSKYLGTSAKASEKCWEGRIK